MAKKKEQPIELPAIEVIATAFAAHRINSGYFKETRRFTEPTPTTFANKELINFKLIAKKRSKEKNILGPKQDEVPKQDSRIYAKRFYQL